MGNKITLTDITNPSLSREDVKALIESRKRNFSLEAPFYNSQDVFDLDMSEIFCKSWIFAGLTCEIPKMGNYMALDIGNNPIFLVRDKDGKIQGFHNTCRHRGHKVVLGDAGKTAKLVCPYHQWTYELDGQLLFANSMEETDGFEKKEFSLHPIAVEVLQGYIFVSLADEPEPFGAFAEKAQAHIGIHDLENAKVAVESHIVEDANWKLVIENNRECYHCNGSHPELLNSLIEFDDTTDPRATDEFKALCAEKEAKWDKLGVPHKHIEEGLRNRIVRMPLLNGVVSMTMDGKRACNKLLGNIPDEDMGAMRFLHLPNSWNHFQGDHLITFRVLPLGPQKTLVTTKWVVHKDAVEGVDYDVERMRHVWDQTNQQDRELAERSQEGINSIAYQPGPYHPTYEFGVINFVDWYCDELAKNL